MQVATDRSLNYIYVVWGLQNEEGIIEGAFVQIRLVCPIFSSWHPEEARTILPIIEQ